MKLITFESGGSVRAGALAGSGILDFGEIGLGASGLASLLKELPVSGIADWVSHAKPTLELGQVRLLPPVPNPSKIICVGVNYRAHREESKQSERSRPTVFSRFADTQMPHGAFARKPVFSDQFDYEGELAVVIGSPAWRVPREKALDVVAGYSVYNDFSVRDWQRHTTQWLPGKNFPCTGGFGPALVTQDEVPDLKALTLTTRVNGEVRQQASLEDLIFDIPALIEYITQFTLLSPGDVIVTGTPGGVGLFMDPPTFLKDDDEVEVDITGVGLLRNTVATEAADEAI